jgi:D-alanyl-lipoteichoic acid acyltransferase DltB (MBOAT superfamily)
LLGIRINENFRSPYQATSLQDFWRRWHISLSTWLRDYLYIPLGGSRGGAMGTYRNLMITMLLGGLWHGASWTFVFWGFLHGMEQALGRMWDRRQEAKGVAKFERPLWQRVIFGLLTFHFVCFAWVFFRADTFGTAMRVLRQIATLTTFHPNLPPTLLAVFAAAIATHLLPHSWFDRMKSAFVALPAVAQAACLFLTAIVLREVASSAAVPFVYFQF